jgi:hypothetical protein
VELLTITVGIFFYFVDLGGIVDYHYINFIYFVDLGGIVDYHYINLFELKKSIYELEYDDYIH